MATSDVRAAMVEALRERPLTRDELIGRVLADPALAEAWRGGPQHRLSQLLRGCRVEPLSELQARAVGALAAQSGVDDVVDVAVTEGALRRGDAVVTSNRSHIEQVADTVSARVRIHDV